MTPDVRIATPADAVVIAAIYAQGVEDRVATFRTEPATVAEVRAWVEEAGSLPVLVHEGSSGVDGWIRVVAYTQAAFYAGVGEYTLYVDRDARRRGAGRALLGAICDHAERAGYWKLIGKLFSTNTPSIALARACGFRDVGVHLRHGRLDGEWRDVLVIERLLGEAASATT